MSLLDDFDDGFTLLEMVIATAILGVLALLITTTVAGQIKKARDAKRKIDFNSIQKSLEQYYDSAACYPSVLPSCNQRLSLGSTTYLAGVPCDPQSQTPYVYVANAGLCSPWYILYTNLEKTDDISIDLAGCRYGCGPQCQYNFGIASPNTSLERCAGPTATPVPTSPPTPTPILYACSPGYNRCEQYDDPTISLCPKVYPDNPTCSNECIVNANRCKNSAGKHVPTN